MNTPQLRHVRATLYHRQNTDQGEHPSHGTTEADSEAQIH